MSNSNDLKYQSTKQFYWLSVLLFLIISLLTCKLLGFNGLYGQDSHEYLRYAKALKIYLLGGENPGNFFWPVAYPLLGAIVSFVIPAKISLQLISIFSAAVCYFYFGKTLNLLYPKGTQRQRFAFICLLCSPFFLRAAVIAMSDMFCCALIITSYFHMVKADKEQNKQSLIYALILSSFAIQTRYAAAFLLLPIIPIFRTPSFRKIPFLLLCIMVVILSISPTLILKNEISDGFLNHPWITNWSPMNLFKHNFDNIDGALNYKFLNVFYVPALIIHPGFCIITVLLIWFMIPNKIITSKWWLVSIIIYLAFLGGIPFQNLRFLLLAFPILLLVLYPGFEIGFNHLKKRTGRLLVLLLLFAIQSALSYRAILPFYRFQQEEITISKELNKFHIASIYTFAIDGALKTYGFPGEIINLWSADETKIKTGSLLLYNPIRFNDQFSNKKPGLIYSKLIQQNRLTYIKDLQNGWKLYTIK